MSRLLVAAFVAAVLVGVRPAPAAAPAKPRPVVLEGATVWRGPGDKLDGGVVVLDGGKVVAVGAAGKVKIPAGAEVIDARGKVITAGLVSVSTQLGLVEIALEDSFDDGGAEGAGGDEDEVHAAHRAADAYNPASVGVPVARQQGVTSSVTAPYGGLVAGQSAWVRLVDGPTAAAVVRAPAAMHATLGNDARGAAGGTRAAVVERLREVLDDARVYGKNKAAYERNASRRLAASRLDLEALGPVLAGRVPLVIDADRVADVRAAIAIGKDFKVRVIVKGGAEAWLVADELAAAKVPVIIDPARNLPGSSDALHVRDDGPAILARAGVPVIVATLVDPGNPGALRQMAGVGVAYGLTWDQALDAVTRAPAQAFGVGDRGTLAVGAAADVVVWSGDPFEVTTRAERVFIGGVAQSLKSRQTLLLERYRKL